MKRLKLSKSFCFPSTLSSAPLTGSTFFAWLMGSRRLIVNTTNASDSRPIPSTTKTAILFENQLFFFTFRAGTPSLHQSAIDTSQSKTTHFPRGSTYSPPATRSGECHYIFSQFSFFISFFCWFSCYILLVLTDIWRDWNCEAKIWQVEHYCDECSHGGLRSLRRSRVGS